MKQQRFKVLMYDNIYVDISLLEKGIYESPSPYLYSIDETIESIQERARMINEKMNMELISKRYFDNFKLCRLEKVNLKLHDPYNDHCGCF